jgi:alkylation response protein AidB-like acyl-CoA dehydrogenase
LDFHETDELASFRDAAREWADENVRPEWVEEQHRTGCFQTMELHRLMARDGLLGAGWAKEYGGTDVDPDYARAVFDECARRGLHSDGWASSCMIIGTISHVATEEQKREYIGGALRGEMMFALGYTEPDSGSDVAAAKTLAVRDGDEWVINGQKMFTSTAQVCTHVFLLVRTDPSLPKHGGLSLFMVPLDGPGVEIHPVHTLGDQVTNATFYTDVRVPHSALIGGVNEGWNVMKVALIYERGAGSPASNEQTLAQDLAAWSKANGRFDDPLTAERIGRIAVEQEVAKVMGQWVRWRAKQALPAYEGTMRKLFSTEAAQRQYSDTMDVLGMAGLLEPGAPGAPAGGRFELNFREAVVTTIYGGTSEVCREIIAERRLGLPRNRPSK